MTEAHSKEQLEVEALLAERKKYEAWLVQLEARRDGAAENVYTRVHADYTERLGAVRAKLSSESDTIGELVSKLEEQLAKEHADVTERTDERAESELRALVGEYSEKEWNSARAKLDAAIAERRSRFENTDRELSDLQELLRNVREVSVPARASVERAAVAAVENDLAQSGGDDGSDAVASADSLELDPEASASDGEPELGAPSEDGASRESAQSWSFRPAADIAPFDGASEEPVAELTPLQAFDTGDASHSQDRASAGPNEGPVKSGDDAESPRAGSTPPEKSFDELAFLRSVAGTPTGADAESAESEAMPLFAESATESESGNTVEEKSSPLGAPTPRTSQAVRSLKCQECGTLNFPTEWYCERCGGELAAF
ncbi:MAG: hypothetical protein O2973_07180 [Gemmatimonadetes bacterium]|nr:hypothetical protein [Gemmatimonadota bacterium]